MRASYRAMFHAVVIGVVVTGTSVSVAGAGEKIAGKATHPTADASRRLMRFESREGDEQVSFTYDAGAMATVGPDGVRSLEGAIVDFKLPFNGNGGWLERSTVGGEEVVNTVELHDRPGDGRAMVVFRYSSTGTGGGPGKLGVSIVAGFCLDTDVFSPLSADSAARSHQGGVLAPSPECGAILSLVKQDLDAVGAGSNAYVGTFQPTTRAYSYFFGFAIFDPTNPGSRGDAYFEAMQSENDEAWRIEAK